MSAEPESAPAPSPRPGSPGGSSGRSPGGSPDGSSGRSPNGSPDRSPLAVTVVGGPTALLEWAGLRLLLGPTFDPSTVYGTGPNDLTKTEGPTVAAADLGRTDVVLAAHDHHEDNLDGAGRAVALASPLVITTSEGARELAVAAPRRAPRDPHVLARPGGSPCGFARSTRSRHARGDVALARRRQHARAHEPEPFGEGAGARGVPEPRSRS